MGTLNHCEPTQNHHFIVITNRYFLFGHIDKSASLFLRKHPQVEHQKHHHTDNCGE